VRGGALPQLVYWCQIAADDTTTHALPLLAGMLASLGDMQTHNHPARLLATAAAAPLAQLLLCLFCLRPRC